MTNYFGPKSAMSTLGDIQRAINALIEIYGEDTPTVLTAAYGAYGDILYYEYDEEEQVAILETNIMTG